MASMFKDVAAGNKRRRSPTSETAAVTPAVRKYVKKCMKKTTEIRYRSFGESVTQGVQFTTGQNVTAIDQGDNVVQRSGNRITPVAYEWRLVATLPAAGVGSIVRCVLVWDKDPNGLVAIPTDIFASNDYLTTQNINNHHRFQILVDRYITLNPPSAVVTSGTGVVHRILKGRAKLDGKVIQFTGSTGIDANCAKGTLRWYVCLDSAVGGTLTNSGKFTFYDQ